MPSITNLFSLYIDELEMVMRTLGEMGCSLADSFTQILFYGDHVVLLSSLLDGLLDTPLFCNTHDLKVNIGKTKVMIFDTSKAAMHREQFIFGGDLVEILTSYTYLEVLFSGPILTMLPSM